MIAVVSSLDMVVLGLMFAGILMQTVLVTEILQPGGVGKVMNVHPKEGWLLLHGQSHEVENSFEWVF